MRRVLALILLSALLVASCAVAPAFGFLERSSVKLSDDEGHGSGVVIGKRLILTARHVANHEGLEAITRDGDRLKTVKVWASEDQDLAILRTEEDFKDSVSIASLTCDVPKIGDAVSVVGHPLDAEFVFGFGHVSSTVSPKGKTVVMDMTVLPGDSGGPVFDAHGRVVGVSIAVLLAPVAGGMMLGGMGSMSGYSLMEPIGDLCRGLPPEALAP